VEIISANLNILGSFRSIVYVKTEEEKKHIIPEWISDIEFLRNEKKT
jgi:hypothetical protein